MGTVWINGVLIQNMKKQISDSVQNVTTVFVNHGYVILYQF